MKKIRYIAISILIWLIIWYLSALLVNKPVFLPGPIDTVRALYMLIRTKEFYQSILFSLLGITKGFFIGLLSGIVLATIASINEFLGVLIDTPVKVIKSVPVASFVVLALLWVNSRALSTLVSAMMVMPVIYTNVKTSITHTDTGKLEMARVFRINLFKKIMYVYLPDVFPSLISASVIASGFAWKSGVAAEIIGLIRNSIGNRIYQSKIYLETAELFAWTITLIVLSILFEKIITLILVKLQKITGGTLNDRD